MDIKYCSITSFFVYLMFYSHGNLLIKVSYGWTLDMVVQHAFVDNKENFDPWLKDDGLKNTIEISFYKESLVHVHFGSSDPQSMDNYGLLPLCVPVVVGLVHIQTYL